jgi:hypothetical protein
MRRPSISFKGLWETAKRPRFIIWASVGIMIFLAFMLVILYVTSSRWFCANACHAAQDDAITAYQHSSHSEISCMACHMPVNATPITFMLHKAEALGELYTFVTGGYPIPLNPESEVALTMKSTQCTQCHSTTNRIATASEGLKIDHSVHAENGIQCTICHNQMAHNEDTTPTLRNPKTGQLGVKHANFMEMTACFRCHSNDPEGKAPGNCELCHAPTFELIPPSHKVPGFYPAGHGKLAKLEESRVVQAGGESWLNSAPTTPSTEAKEGEKASSEASSAAGKEGESEFAGEELPKVEQINVCSTCHSREFCITCHGVALPHPSNWKDTHGALGKQNPAMCQKCHGYTSDFCNQCHHSTTLDWQYDPATPWIRQHPLAVRAVGTTPCFKCHRPTYCARCHVGGPSAVGLPSTTR